MFQKNIWLFARNEIDQIYLIFFFETSPPKKLLSYTVYFSLFKRERQDTVPFWFAILPLSFFCLQFFYWEKTFKSRFSKPWKYCKHINTLLNINKSLSLLLSRHSLLIWGTTPSFTLKYITSNLSKSWSLLSSVPVINM